MLIEHGRIHRKVFPDLVEFNRIWLIIIFNVLLTVDLFFRTRSDDQNLVLGLKNATFPTSSHSSFSSR